MLKLVAAVVLLVWATRAHADPPRAEVLVRVYNVFGVRPGDLRAAERVAQAILRAAGVGVTWRQCRPSRGKVPDANDPCGQVVGPLELIVRITTGPPTGDQQVTTFGSSVVDVQARAGVLSTVFADRVATVARRADISRGHLLGVTMAHELGHLLLGTSTHSAEGLMRPHWPDALLRLQSAHAWRVSPNEATAMATALLARVTRSGPATMTLAAGATTVPTVPLQ
jgi:hypothetical protein